MDFQELAVFINGGEYRIPLPGRGITIVHKYEPMYVVFARSMNEFSKKLIDLTKYIVESEIDNEQRFE